MKTLTTTFLSLLLASQANAEDVIYLKTGESAVCRIDAITPKITNFTLLSDPGPAKGSARRTVATDRIDYFVFGFKPGEETVYQNRKTESSEVLEKWWNTWFAYLGRRRSRTAAFGNAFGHALLREDPAIHAKRALSIYDRIIAKAWSAEDVAEAKQGRLRALMAMGDLETATHEAQLLAGETEDPGLLIEVKYLLAQADFETLKALVEENPKWEEDDEVRPERNRLYHIVVDQLLWPHLFHATRENEAARGLFGVAGVYRFAGEEELARAACEDLIQLYPETDFTPGAVAFVEQIQSQSAPDPPEKENP
ncbi:MAG: hypothetical protein P1U86_11070 [Verrucomicrobiales bacterium]|nr:hypothetical protein [Verrucomicrobiales bacterium]